MPVIPVKAHVEIGVIQTTFGAKIGLTVDKPLSSRINRPGEAIGTIDIFGFKTFDTTVNVSISGKGLHYIVLGIDYGGYVLPSIASYILRLELLGSKAEILKQHVPSYARRYLAVIVEVDKDGIPHYVNQSEVEPDQPPIITQNTGGFFGTEPLGDMSEVMGNMLKMMMPIMMLNMTMNMMVGLMNSMVGMVRA
jgi:hypothetical protein